MSTFDGVLKEYPLISIDNFTEECENYTSTIYFLSHCHKDHMRGLGDAKFFELLTSRRFSKIYMSPVSEHLLKNDPEYFHLSNFLFSIPMEEPILIGIPDAQGNICSQVVVTLLTAGHCPGSVMFLFEGCNGRVLYTGDFRLPIGSSARLINLHDENGRLKRLDSLYVDTTFCKEECMYIPSREECLTSIISLVEPWLAKGPEYIVYFFCPAQYAYEFVFVELFKKFKVKTHVTEEKENKYHGIKNIEDAVTSLSTDARIHACMYDMDMLPFNEFEIETPCGYHTLDYKPIKIMKIKPSAMFFQKNEFQDISTFERRRQFYRVCYSTHSSLSEVRDLVHYLKPKFVNPNVVQRQTINEILDLIFVSSSCENSKSDLQDEKGSIPPLGMLKTFYEEDNILSSSDSMPFYDECYKIPLKRPTGISSLPENLYQSMGENIEQDDDDVQDKETVHSVITSPIKWDFTLSSEDELSSSPIKMNSSLVGSNKQVSNLSLSIKTSDMDKTVANKNAIILENQSVSSVEESMSDSFELRASMKFEQKNLGKADFSNDATNENEIIDSSIEIQKECFVKEINSRSLASKSNICDKRKSTERTMYNFLNDHLSHLFSSEENEIPPVIQMGNVVDDEISDKRIKEKEKSTLTKENCLKSACSKISSNSDNIQYQFLKSSSAATNVKPITIVKHNFSKDNIKYNFFKQISPEPNLKLAHFEKGIEDFPVQAASHDIKQIESKNKCSEKEIWPNKPKCDHFVSKSHDTDANYPYQYAKKPLHKVGNSNKASHTYGDKTSKVCSDYYHKSKKVCSGSDLLQARSQMQKNHASSVLNNTCLNSVVPQVDEQCESHSNYVASHQANITTHNETQINLKCKNQNSPFNKNHCDIKLRFSSKEHKIENKSEMLNKDDNILELSKCVIDSENRKDKIQNIDESSSDSVCIMSNDSHQSGKAIELVELSSDESDDEKCWRVESCLSGKAKYDCDKSKSHNVDCNKTSAVSHRPEIVNLPCDPDDSPSLIEPKKAKLSTDNIISEYSVALPEVQDYCVPVRSTHNYIQKCSNNKELPDFQSTPNELPSVKNMFKTSFELFSLKNSCDEIVIDDDS